MRLVLRKVCCRRWFWAFDPKRFVSCSAGTALASPLASLCQGDGMEPNTGGLLSPKESTWDTFLLGSQSYPKAVSHLGPLLLVPHSHVCCLVESSRVSAPHLRTQKTRSLGAESRKTEQTSLTKCYFGMNTRCQFTSVGGTALVPPHRVDECLYT